MYVYIYIYIYIYIMYPRSPDWTKFKGSSDVDMAPAFAGLPCSSCHILPSQPIL